MAQVRHMLALNAARKEREDWNEALEELCVLRSQVSSTATVWYLPNRNPPAGRNRLCGRAVTDAASVAVNECSRWRLAFQPVRSFRSHFGCADGSGVLSLCRKLAEVQNPDLSDSRLNGAQEAARRRDEAQGATLLRERDRKRELAEDREVRANAVAHPPAGA